MKRKVIQFDAKSLVGSVEARAVRVRNKRMLTMRSRALTLPKPIKSIPPRGVVAIRKKLNVSQNEFASLLNIPAVTAISWEKGRSKPSGAALRLLDLVRTKPGILAGV